MNKGKKYIQVFEHEALYTDRGESKINVQQLEAMQLHHKTKHVKYYTLVHRGIKFNEYAGVLQVGSLIIEVLPKSDRFNDKGVWHNILISMLKTVGTLDIHASNDSSLNLKSNSILELYFELFINETERLLHKGLVKKYRKTENNLTSLKGKLNFATNIQKNIVHKERFYVSYYIYDKEHKLNSILYKTLKLLALINKNAVLSSRIGALFLVFPEMPEIKVNEKTFSDIIYNRKTEAYRSAIQIAKLLLLNFHPDIKRGKNDVLALMFDMNLLWEKFVLKSLNKYKQNEYTLRSQVPKNFWKPVKGKISSMKPDIIVRKNDGTYLILDTKWKNLGRNNVKPEDLRQMYAYSKYHANAKTALVYPGENSDLMKGNYFKEDSDGISENECSLLPIEVCRDVRIWQKQISERVFGLFEKEI